MADKDKIRQAVKVAAQSYLPQHANTHPAYTPQQTAGPSVPAGAIMIRREFRTRRVQLLLKPMLYERLKARADANEISMNQLVHSILEEYEKTHSE